MSKYRSKLAAVISENCPPTLLQKLQKDGCDCENTAPHLPAKTVKTHYGSYDSTLGGAFSKIDGETCPDGQGASQGGDFENMPPRPPAKTARSPFGSYDSTQGSPFPEIEEAGEPDALPDPKMERRRQWLLAELRRHPEVQRVFLVDGDSDPVRVALGIRGKGTCELTIPAGRWDPIKFR